MVVDDSRMVILLVLEHAKQRVEFRVERIEPCGHARVGSIQPRIHRVEAALEAGEASFDAGEATFDAGEATIDAGESRIHRREKS